MPVPTEVLVQNTITVPVEEYSDPQIDASPAAPEQQLAITLQAPVVTIEYNEPGQFPLLLAGPEVNAPTIQISPDVFATLDLVLALHAPSLSISNAITPVVLSLGLTLEASTLTIDSQVFPASFGLTISSANTLSPTIGVLSVSITKYIKDPLRTGGCAQCGTFLYESVRGRSVRGVVIKRGRNFDQDKGRREDRYVKCGRCGWTNHLDRAVHLQPDSSRAGWGLNYEQFEVIPNDPL